MMNAVADKPYVLLVLLFSILTMPAPSTAAPIWVDPDQPFYLYRFEATVTGATGSFATAEDIVGRKLHGSYGWPVDRSAVRGGCGGSSTGVKSFSYCRFTDDEAFFRLKSGNATLGADGWLYIWQEGSSGGPDQSSWENLSNRFYGSAQSRTLKVNGPSGTLPLDEIGRISVDVRPEVDYFYIVDAAVYSFAYLRAWAPGPAYKTNSVGTLSLRLETLPAKVVPLPAAAWLFGPALAGLWAARRFAARR